MNSSSSFANTVDLQLTPSRRIFSMVLVLHGGLLVAAPFVMPEGRGILVLAALVGASWLYCRRHAALGFGRNALNRILLREDGQWLVGTGAGQPREAKLLPGSVVRGRWLVLRFSLDQGGTRTRLVAGDEADPDALRRLRARLSAGAV